MINTRYLKPRPFFLFSQKILNFKAEEHQYTFGSDEVISASGVNGFTQKHYGAFRTSPFLIQAAQRGKDIHAMIETHIRQRAPFKGEWEKFGEYIISLYKKDWIPVLIERRLISAKAKKPRIAGMPDAVWYDKKNGEYIIVDWKSNKYTDEMEFYYKYQTQLNIYRCLLFENFQIESMTKIKTLLVFVKENEEPKELWIT